MNPNPTYNHSFLYLICGCCITAEISENFNYLACDMSQSYGKDFEQKLSRFQAVCACARLPFIMKALQWSKMCLIRM
jgi:hypothetical protein